MQLLVNLLMVLLLYKLQLLLMGELYKLHQLLMSRVSHRDLRRTTMCLIRFNRLSHRLFHFITRRKAISGKTIVRFTGTTRTAISVFSQFSLQTSTLRLCFMSHIRTKSITIRRFRLLRMATKVLISTVQVVHGTLVQVRGYIKGINRQVHRLTRAFRVLKRAQGLFRVFLHHFHRFHRLKSLFNNNTRFLSAIKGIFHVFFTRVRTRVTRSNDLLTTWISVRSTDGLIINHVLEQVSRVKREHINRVQAIRQILQFRGQRRFFPIVFIR